MPSAKNPFASRPGREAWFCLWRILVRRSLADFVDAPGRFAVVLHFVPTVFESKPTAAATSFHPHKSIAASQSGQRQPKIGSIPTAECAQLLRFEIASHRSSSTAAVHAATALAPVKMGLVSGHTACNIGATRPATLQDRRRSAGVAAVVPPISRAGRGIGATSAPPPAGLVLLPRAGRGGGRAVIAQPLDRFRHCHHARSSSITVPYKPMRRYCCTAWI